MASHLALALALAAVAAGAAACYWLCRPRRRSPVPRAAGGVGAGPGAETPPLARSELLSARVAPSADLLGRALDRPNSGSRVRTCVALHEVCVPRMLTPRRRLQPCAQAELRLPECADYLRRLAARALLFIVVVGDAATETSVLRAHARRACSRDRPPAQLSPGLLARHRSRRGRPPRARRCFTSAQSSLTPMWQRILVCSKRAGKSAIVRHLEPDVLIEGQPARVAFKHFPYLLRR